MPRRLRKDHPGAWHHIWNRGVAKRTLCETRRDVRRFLASLAREARAGELEIHAYVVLTTHFHLLVRSPRGRLSAAMQRVEDSYARWFNRTRRRDGPLFRGRFGNRVVDSEAYWWCVLGYIDRNPVDAGLCARPRDYPHGSARQYGRAGGPAWLRRDAVEAALGRRGGEAWDPRLYAAFEDEGLSPGQRWVAERRCASPVEGPDPLDDLLGAAPDRVRRWMEGKAALADGPGAGAVLVSPATVLGIARASAAADPGRTVAAGPRRLSLWEVVEAGALRGFCGLRLRELSGLTGRPVGTLQRRLEIHAAAMGSDPAYQAEVSSLLAEAVAADHGGGGGRGGRFLRAPGRWTALPSIPPVRGQRAG